MTDRSEWVEVVQLLRALWPHSEIPDSTLAAWYDAVADLPTEQVMVAVNTLARDGREYPPTGGMIRQQVIALREDAPQWGPVWRLIRKAQMKAPALPGEEDKRGEFLCNNGLASVAEFMEAIGWPLPEEWGEDHLESRVRRKWEEWQRDRQAGAAYAGLPHANLPRLERSSGGGLRKLSPPKVIGPGEGGGT